MKYEEVLKELFEVCQYLRDKDEELRQKYGDYPEFESQADSWTYRILRSATYDKALTLINEFESASGYISKVGEQGYRAGEGFSLSQATGQLQY